MTKTLLLLTTLFSFVSINTALAQIGNVHFQNQLASKPNEIIAFAINNDGIQSLKLIEKDKITLKYITPTYLYIQATAAWIFDKTSKKEISGFYFERSDPRQLSDSSILKHNIGPLHQGELFDTKLTGKDVIIGYLDNGMDFMHPDFIDSNGNTRVMYYWKQGAAGPNPPLPFNYGGVCDSAMINAGTCPFTDGLDHGTTVAGVGSGNARANGLNKGMAPDSKIIMVHTNEAAPNWTLTIADACAFVFQKAALLGLPAVMNISYGDYFGSHDNLDPASVMMEGLVDAQVGRLIVAAAGNAGNIGKWHVEMINSGTDTSAVFLIPNPASAYGPNSMYFDLWANSSVAPNLKFSITADRVSPNFSERASTPLLLANQNLNVTSVFPLTDGINLLGNVTIFREVVNGRFHLECLIQNVDSANFRYRLNTVNATAPLDLWSGAAFGLSNFETNASLISLMPINHTYSNPDSLKTMVSSWVNSDHIITVGNVRNRVSYIDVNGNLFTPSAISPPLKLSVNSSKGPSRIGLQKPDVCAAGDMTLSAGTLATLASAAGTNLLGQGGMHLRNGGTSIASPTIAGIAALYLQYCPNASWQDMKAALIGAAEPTPYSGLLPNYGYGHGLPNASKLWDVLPDHILTTSLICPISPASVGTSILVNTILWSTNETINPISINLPQEVFATYYNNQGCKLTDSIVVSNGNVPVIPVIVTLNNISQLTYTPLQNGYAGFWYLNGTLINSNMDTIPYIGTGNYTVELSPLPGNCSTISAIYNNLSLEENNVNQLFIYPNPTNGEILISGNETIQEISLLDSKGAILKTILSNENKVQINLADLASGIYTLVVKVNDLSTVYKIAKY